MNAPPLPITLAFVILLGWPALKLITAALARPYWRRSQALRGALLSDPAYAGEDRRSVIDAELAEAKGQPIFLLMPVVVFFGGIAIAISELLGKSDIIDDASDLEDAPKFIELYGKSALTHDRRFRELIDLSFTLNALHYPVCSILTLVALIAVSPLILICGGLKISLRLVFIRMLRSSATATMAFERGISVRRAT